MPRAETLTAGCPVCGGPNGCRLETGEAYKGPCWCEELTLPDQALRRLRAELSEPRCLCRGCLILLASRPGASWAQLAALGRNSTGGTHEARTDEEGAFDPDGALSRAFLLRRGSCCQNGCRNCPYGFDSGSGPQPSLEDTAP